MTPADPERRRDDMPPVISGRDRRAVEHEQLGAAGQERGIFLGHGVIDRRGGPNPHPVDDGDRGPSRCQGIGLRRVTRGRGGLGRRR